MRFFLCFCALLCTLSTSAAVTLPDVLADNMVLQRDQEVAVWGRATPGERVRVLFMDQQLESTADEDGEWMVRLAPLAASSVPYNLTISGENTIVLKNILVGEVWLCSGQSNMQWRLLEADGGAEAIARANNPEIRLFNVSREVGFGREAGKLATWQPAVGEATAEFSAVGYFFGLALYRRLGVPIGLINASYGGSQAEAWTPRQYLADDPDLAPTIDRETRWAEERAQVSRKYERAVQDWERARKRALADGDPEPRAPRVPDALRDYRIAGSIYGNMVEPLIPYGIRGVAWYQGESNEERAEQYQRLLTTMIGAWRDRWQQGSMPFAIVQLPNYRKVSAEPEDSAWAHLRDRQRRVADSLLNTGLIVTIDIGAADDIHPTNKLPVGERLAQWALSEVYGRETLAGGPVLRRVEYRPGEAIVYFDQVGEGLLLSEGDAPAEFALAGADGAWHWAEARLEGRTRVILSSAAVPEPVAVRYSFNSNPRRPNLTNATGIPAAPFRTDDWPGPTHGRR